jgi:ribosome-associated toxin RatA of RatAB toxin-antitoxin module
MAETVSVVDTGAQQITRRALVQAPAADVFALVANPHCHPELDGSGTVRSAPVVGPETLSVGATFTVAMKQHGVRYKIKSKVTAFEPDKIVEWQHPGGHRWRWEFAEIEPGTTQVTETFDYTTAKAPKMLELFRVPKQNAAGITKTLEALQARFS